MSHNCKVKECTVLKMSSPAPDLKLELVCKYVFVQCWAIYRDFQTGHVFFFDRLILFHSEQPKLYNIVLFISEIIFLLGKYLVLEFATTKSHMKPLVVYIEQNLFLA